VFLLRHPTLEIGLFCAFLLGASIVLAQESSSQSTSVPGVQKDSPIPEYIQEFFLSEAVRSQDQGELQITFGADSRVSLGSNLMYDMEYGLTNRLQLSSQTRYGLTATSKSEVPAGWSTTAIGLQYQIIRSNSPFALTAGMSFGTPVRGGAALEYDPEILAAKGFHKVQVHASFVAGVTWEIGGDKNNSREN